MPETAATSIAEGKGNDRVNTNPRYFETVIIGTGFSGLLAAIRLKKYDLDDFVLLERSSELGGTWRDNSYPGAEVDVPTGLYSISFIPYPFKKRYAPQSELLEYTNYIIDKFHLRKHAKTNQAVTKLTYDESRFVWHVEVASGERYVARFVIDTSGVLANPRMPYIEGAESFQGAAFHTAQWDHNVPYEGKRVGVIGSGCSAAQVVPAIAGRVARLTVFMGQGSVDHSALGSDLQSCRALHHESAGDPAYQALHDIWLSRGEIHRISPLSIHFGHQQVHQDPVCTKSEEES